MGQCNYCSLKDFRRRHKCKGRIYLRPGPIDKYTKALGQGIDVIFVPKGKTISEGEKLVWFMELPEKCVC